MNSEPDIIEQKVKILSDAPIDQLPIIIGCYSMIDDWAIRRSNPTLQS